MPGQSSLCKPFCLFPSLKKSSLGCLNARPALGSVGRLEKDSWLGVPTLDIWNAEIKGGAVARRTLDSDISAHQASQLTADGQPDADAFLSPRLDVLLSL